MLKSGMHLDRQQSWARYGHAAHAPPDAELGFHEETLSTHSCLVQVQVQSV